MQSFLPGDVIVPSGTMKGESLCIVLQGTLSNQMGVFSCLEEGLVGGSGVYDEIRA